MKRIDLHIHTISTKKDSKFDFDIEWLKSYIQVRNIDAIAITNHNEFNKDQYHEISKSLQCIVFPGIEIDLEKGHILVIAPTDRVDQFESECGKVQSKLSTDNSLDISSFMSIFNDLSHYLVIPHYRKKPNIQASIINQLSQFIVAGEVDNPKKWEVSKKTDSDLVPVLFSDARCEQSKTIGIEFPTRQTLVEIDEIDIPKLKVVLSDRRKVHLFEKDTQFVFPLSNDLVSASTGLNIVIGRRSSGKSYTLDSIAREYPESTYYIGQFKLIGKNSDEDFKKTIDQLYESVSYQYLAELRVLVDRLQSVNLQETEAVLGRFTRELIADAKKQSVHDIFSQSTLFRETKIPMVDNNLIIKLIEATIQLLDAGEFQTLILDVIERDQLIQVLKDLVFTYRKRVRKNKLIEITNDSVTVIKNILATRSSRTPLPEIEFGQIVRENYLASRFNDLIENGDKEIIFQKKNYGDFSIYAKRSPHNNLNQIRKSLKIKKSLGDFNSLKPFDKVKHLQNNASDLGIDYSAIHKAFWQIEYEVKNSSGLDLSGGEKAEFNLLKELENAKDSSVILIDELESSFDNLFLHKNIVTMLKNLAKDSALFLVTHNNTLGLSLQPDCILYTEKEMISGKPRFRVYSGSLSSKELTHHSGDTVSNYFTLMSTMEAGETAYNERRIIYESLKD